MRETTLQIFEGMAVFTVKIVGAFKMETRRGHKRDLLHRHINVTE